MSLLTAKLDGHARALDLLAQRQKVLAGNIANADTPGFKARDFDFAQALAQARGGSGGTATTNPRHLQASGAPAGAGASPETLFRASDQPALDGNTVDLDRERAHFADNSLRYESTLRFINHDVRTLLSAITGQ
ncbi:MAG TPA: flagellar basal body rod protein FlgB [Ramlibacter sp.]|jgi:flagellar basal-body rod protein FlgB|uniref:flagellar basal body rod protein FlgB n=1 Tax=Ramlibacter sp. TaxID=1917967 RepID=UPI002D458522|nr:flagellar basal body rod protein FlgB [Ramlibacter sp.]HZY18573.1 flagellar basal body rod protein FlgB [Ramlibacter sp.]